MIEKLSNFFHALTWESIIIGIVLFLVSFAVSIAAISIVMVKIPPNYFSSHYERDFLPNSPWLVRWGVVILKNILGVFLVLLGLALSVPGIPGQGFLTILLGLIMLDIPGKRPIEAMIIKRPRILAAVNRLRRKYGKPELVMD